MYALAPLFLEPESLPHYHNMDKNTLYPSPQVNPVGFLFLLVIMKATLILFSEAFLT